MIWAIDEFEKNGEKHLGGPKCICDANETGALWTENKNSQYGSDNSVAVKGSEWAKK